MKSKITYEDACLLGMFIAVYPTAYLTDGNQLYVIAAAIIGMCLGAIALWLRNKTG